jgi:hypothetical protein
MSDIQNLDHLGEFFLSVLYNFMLYRMINILGHYLLIETESPNALKIKEMTQTSKMT